MNKIVWLKKAKCAGTSLETAFMESGLIYYIDSDTKRCDLGAPENKVICIRSGIYQGGTTNRRVSEKQYVTVPSLRGHGLFKTLLRIPLEPVYFMEKLFPDVLDSYWSFAIVRNPYDKFVSSWKYLKSLRKRPIEYVLENLPKKRNFHDWLHITKKQYEFVINSKGEFIVDHIVYMEDFANDLAVITDKLSIPEIKLQHKNKTIRRKYSDYLTPSVRNAIYQKYKLDFSVFGYSYDENKEYPEKKCTQGELRGRNISEFISES